MKIMHLYSQKFKNDQKNMKLDVNLFPPYSSGVTIISHFLVYHPKFPMHDKHAWHAIESIGRCIVCLSYFSLLFSLDSRRT